MPYLYSYVKEGKPYYVGKGTKNRAFIQENHSVPVPKNKSLIHILSHYNDNVKALIREWELITFLGLKTEGGMLDNKVKGCCPPDRTGAKQPMSEEHKQKLRKPKPPRTPEHSEKIAVQNRGKKHSEEHRRKITESLKRAYEEGRRKPPTKPIRALTYLVTHPDGTEEVVTNIAQFCRENNLSRACVCNVAKGRQEQHRGFKFSYVNK